MTRFALWMLLSTLAVASIGCRAGAHTSDEAHTHDHGAPGELPTPYPDRIALTWSDAPTTTLSVTWRTDTTVTASQAQIALAKAEPSFFTAARTIDAAIETLDLTHIVGERVKAHYHSVKFTGLVPDTLYAYRVGDGDHWSEWFHARTASDTDEPMSFLYFGDAQNNLRSLWSRAIRAAYKQAPDARFMIHAGDLVNNAHRNIEWGEWHQAGGFIHSMLPSVPVPGNHEYDPLETWVEPDTFRVSATFGGSTMDGTVIEPGGDDEPFAATGNGSATDADDLAGTWNYTIDDGDYEGTLRMEQTSDGYSGVLVSGGDTEIPLRNVTVNGDTFSAEFVTDVEKEGPEHLSAHWRPGFALPMNGARGFKESTYFLDIQGVRVIGLNSDPAGDDADALAVQTAWLDSVLTNNSNRWTVVTFHHPIFSSSEGRDNPELRAAWKPLFDRHGVDLVLQGHDHTYARGRAENLVQGVNVRSPIGGTVYVNSVSGAKMYELKPERWENYASIDLDRAAENTQLFQVIRVSGDTLRFHAYTVTGELYDAFDLIKRENSPNRFIARVDENVAERGHDNTAAYARP